MAKERGTNPWETPENLERRERLRLEFRGAIAYSCPPVSGLASWLQRVPPQERGDLLVDLVAEHLQHRAALGQIPQLEEYISQFGGEFAEFQSLASIPADLVEVEFIARHSDAASDHPPIEEYEARFASRPDAVALVHDRCFGDGRYVRLRRHEDGGFGRVWIAYDSALHRTVAIKEPHPVRGRGTEESERLHREARFAALLDHPAIVSVHELSAGDRPYYVMRLVQGKDLGTLIREGPVDDPILHSRLLRSFVTVCDAMAYAHSRGVIHADLKPTNILVGDFGETVIVDWGLARQISEIGTAPLPVEGTKAYMAPERWRGELSPASDVWSLGGILRHVLTGKPPPEGTVSGRPLTALEAVCNKAMSESPSGRYTAKELGAEVLRFLADERVTAWREPIWHRVGRLFRRRRILQVGFLLAVALALTILVAAVMVLRSALEREREARKTAQDAETESQKSAVKERDARRLAQAAHDEGLKNQHRMALTLAEQDLARGHLREAQQNVQRIPVERLGWEWRRLALQVGSGPRVRRWIGSHGYSVHAMSATPDGKSAVTAGLDGRVICWDLETGKPHMLQEGTWLDHELRWSNAMRQGNKKHNLVTAVVAVSSTEALGTTLGGELISWDVKTGARRSRFAGKTPLLHLSASGADILVGSDDGDLTLLDLEGQILAQRQCGSAISSIRRISEKRWAVGSKAGNIMIVSGAELRTDQTWSLPGPIWDIDVDNSSTLAVAAEEPLVRTYRFEPGQGAFIQSEAYQHGKVGTMLPLRLTSVRWLAKGSRLVATDGNGHFVQWRRGEQTTSIVQPINPECRRTSEDSWPLPLQRRLVIEPIPATEDVLLGGYGGEVVRWDTQSRSCEWKLSIGANSRFCFDPFDDDVLWCGDADGSLQLRHIETGRTVARTPPTGHGAILDQAVCPKSGVCVTAGSDRTVRFWRRKNDGIEPVLQPLAVGKSIESIAVSPSEETLAVVADGNALEMWNIYTALRERSYQLPGAKRGLPGIRCLVRFAPDGASLAVTGPGAACRILTFGTDRLEFIENQVAGNGATALAWDPKWGNGLVTGDTLGRLKPSIPPQRFNQAGYGPKQPIAGLAYTPEGDRCVCATVGGEVFVIDHRGIGVVHTLPCGPLARDCQLQFDVMGRRLAALQDSGDLVVWNAIAFPNVPESTPWVSKLIWQGPCAKDAHGRENCCSLDNNDRLWVLLTNSVDDARVDQRGSDGEIALVRETDAEGTPVKRWSGAPRSIFHALLHRDGTIYAAIREKSDALVWCTKLYSSRDSFEKPQTIIPVHANDGGYLLLLPGDSGQPDAYHFDFRGNYLMRSSWSKEGWRSKRIGRQGDGINALGIRDASGKHHLVFPSYRHGDDLEPLQYLRLNAAGDLEHRMPVRSDLERASGSLFTDMHGRPFVEVRKPRPCESIDITLNDESGVPQTLPLRLTLTTPSNPIVDAQGNFHVAYLSHRHPGICLASSGKTGWQHRLILRFREVDIAPRREIHLLRDSKGRPVVVLFAFDQQRASIEVLRQQ